MALPQKSDSLGNILRLQGFKNASGRKKVLPGTEFLHNLDAVDTDVSGVASDMSPSSENLPDLEMGNELSPQSYDVRANKVISQEQPAQESMWTKLGRSLGAKINQNSRSSEASPPIETQQVEAAEGLPPVSASQQIPAQKPSGMNEMGIPPVAQASLGPDVLKGSLGILGQLLPKLFSDRATPEETQKKIKELPPTDLLSIPPIVKKSLGLVGQTLPDTLGSAEKQQEWRDYNEDEALRAQGLDPEVARAEKSQEMMQSVEKAMEEPWEHSAYGAAETVAEHPALQAEFKKLTGVDYDDQIQQQVSQYEGAMKGVEDALKGIQTSLSEQEEAIKQRILSNQANDMDKYYIGLALAMPLIIGGFFGKEAGIGALGGAAKGLASVFEQRGKNIREDEGSLFDISKQKAGNEEKISDLQLRKAQLPMEIRKNLPADENADLLGRESIEYVDPETKEKVMAVGLAPGLFAKDKYLKSKDSIKNMEKAATELSDSKSYVDTINDQTGDIIYITSQLKDKDALAKVWNAVVSKKVPGSLSKLTEDVEFEGRKVNAGSILQEKLGFIANAYAQANKLGQLDRAAQNHIEKIMLNPTSTLASNRDVIDQMLETRKLAQRSIVKNAKNKGFIPEFLMKEFEDTNKNVLDRLNKGQQAKRLEEIKQKTARSGTTYAK